MTFTGFGYATPDMVNEAQRARQPYQDPQSNPGFESHQHHHHQDGYGAGAGGAGNKRRTPFQDPYAAQSSPQARADPFGQQQYGDYQQQQGGFGQRNDQFGQRRDPFAQQAQGQYQAQPQGMPKRKADPFTQQAQGGYDAPPPAQFPGKRDPFAQQNQYGPNDGGYPQKQDPFGQQAAYGGQQVQKPNPFAGGNFSDDSEDDEASNYQNQQAGYQSKPQQSYDHKRKVDPFASSLDNRNQYSTPSYYQQADVKFEESGEKKQGKIKTWLKSKKKNTDEFGSYASTDGEDEEVAYEDNKNKNGEELDMLPPMQIKPNPKPQRSHKRKKTSDSVQPSNLNPHFTQPFNAPSGKFDSDEEYDEDNQNYNETIPPPKGFGNSPFGNYSGTTYDSPSPPRQKGFGNQSKNPFQSQLMDDDNNDGYVPPPQRESPFPKPKKPSPFEIQAQQGQYNQPLQDEDQQYQPNPSFPQAKPSPFQQQAAPQAYPQRASNPFQQQAAPQVSPFQQQAAPQASPFQQQAAPQFQQPQSSPFQQPQSSPFQQQAAVPFGQTRSTPAFQPQQQQFGQTQFNNYAQPAPAYQTNAQPAYMQQTPPPSADDLLFGPGPTAQVNSVPAVSDIMTLDLTTPQQQSTAPLQQASKPQGMFDEFGDLVQLDLKPGSPARPKGKAPNIRGSFQ